MPPSPVRLPRPPDLRQAWPETKATVTAAARSSPAHSTTPGCKGSRPRAGVEETCTGRRAAGKPQSERRSGEGCETSTAFRSCPLLLFIVGHLMPAFKRPAPLRVRPSGRRIGNLACLLQLWMAVLSAPSAAGCGCLIRPVQPPVIRAATRRDPQKLDALSRRLGHLTCRPGPYAWQPRQVRKSPIVYARFRVVER